MPNHALPLFQPFCNVSRRSTPCFNLLLVPVIEPVSAPGICWQQDPFRPVRHSWYSTFPGFRATSPQDPQSMAGTPLELEKRSESRKMSRYRSRLSTCVWNFRDSGPASPRVVTVVSSIVTSRPPVFRIPCSTDEAVSAALP
jgi:hypothetical protein